MTMETPSRVVGTADEAEGLAECQDIGTAALGMLRQGYCWRSTSGGAAETNVRDVEKTLIFGMTSILIAHIVSGLMMQMERSWCSRVVV